MQGKETMSQAAVFNIKLMSTLSVSVNTYMMSIVVILIHKDYSLWQEPYAVKKKILS